MNTHGNPFCNPTRQEDISFFNKLVGCKNKYFFADKSGVLVEKANNISSLEEVLNIVCLFFHPQIKTGFQNESLSLYLHKGSQAPTVAYSRRKIEFCSLHHYVSYQTACLLNLRV